MYALLGVCVRSSGSTEKIISVEHKEIKNTKF